MAEPIIDLTRPTPAASRRWRRWLGRFGMVVAGLAVGLIVAEVVFRQRDDGAFPHVNFYVADPELGVRLAPGETERISFGGNPVTSIRINADGYRGADLPPPGTDEVLVVGDSQVFGLGVEEDDTFSARLGRALGRTVVNAGVPTYGPGEYRAVIAEQLARRKPKTVIVAVNLVNDLFEVSRPNKDRHAVWDGWAVRKETAPDGVTWFPGRDFVYRRSHLFFALRKWWNDDRLDERGFASEGTWKDLVTVGEQVRTERGAVRQRLEQHGAELGKLEHDLTGAEASIDSAIEEVLRDNEAYEYNVLYKARANPGDIVEDNEFAESGRAIVVTSDQIRRAATVRAKLRKELERWAKAKRSATAKQALASLDARDKLLERLSEVDAQRIQAALEPPLAGYLRDVQQLVESHGARLVVVVLPIDVQVSATEWAKYGATPLDMSATQALTTELVELGGSLGVTVVDATQPLAAAEPGAFLDKDIHMSAKGHAAVAAAIVTALAQPVKRLASRERSPIPVPAIWAQAPEVIVTGSTAAGCETKQVREWLRVLCSRTASARPPTRVDLERDDGNESLKLVMPHGVALVVPVVPGREYAAKITWPDRTRVLRVRWPEGDAKPTLAFDAPVVTGKPGHLDSFAAPGFDRRRFDSDVERTICDCWNRVHGGNRFDGGNGEEFECLGAYGATDAACTATYPPDAGKPEPGELRPGRCDRLLACIRRDPASPPGPRTPPGPR